MPTLKNEWSFTSTPYGISLNSVQSGPTTASPVLLSLHQIGTRRQTWVNLISESLILSRVHVSPSFCSYRYRHFWRCGPTRTMASSFMRFLVHTRRRNTVGRTPLDQWSARRRDLYLTTHNTHMRQTSMYLAGFEPTAQEESGRRPTS